jgi:hypothetical protein
MVTKEQKRNIKLAEKAARDLELRRLKEERTERANQRKAKSVTKADTRRVNAKAKEEAAYQKRLEEAAKKGKMAAQGKVYVNPTVKKYGSKLLNVGKRAGVQILRNISDSNTPKKKKSTTASKKQPNKNISREGVSTFIMVDGAKFLLHDIVDNKVAAQKEKAMLRRNNFFIRTVTKSGYYYIYKRANGG